MSGARRKTAALGVKFSVQTTGGILRRGDLHYASKFPAVLSWKTGGHHAHGIHVARFKWRRERRRAILRQRQTIHDELHIVFRAARVQHSVGFIQPPGLRVHHAKNATARLGR